MPPGSQFNFAALFLDATDLPADMNLYLDRRDGVNDPDDPEFAVRGGCNIGMTKWEGTNDSLLRLLVDIRWMFPDPQSATAYHLATLKAKGEGKPEIFTAKKVGDDCHIYNYPSGQNLGAMQGIFSRSLGRQSQIVRRIDGAIADMPNDAFIYLFTCGSVVVKLFAVLGPSPFACKEGPAVVYKSAYRIVGRIDNTFPADTRKVGVWLKNHKREFEAKSEAAPKIEQPVLMKAVELLIVIISVTSLLAVRIAIAAFGLVAFFFVIGLCFAIIKYTLNMEFVNRYSQNIEASIGTVLHYFFPKLYPP